MATLNFRDPSKDVQTLTVGSDIKSAEDLILRPAFLMCEPTYYDPRKETRSQVNGYVENEMCETSNHDDFDPDLAHDQHAQLREAILDLGGSIILSPGSKGILDNVFKADPSLTIANPQFSDDGKLESVYLKTIASNFYHHARNPEVTSQMGDIMFFRNMMMEQFGIGVSSFEYHAELHGEGTGDNVYDAYRDIFWCGYKPKSEDFDPSSGRSDPSFHKVLEDKLGMQGRTQALEVNGKFFHIDTCLAPLPNGEILCFQDGMTDDAFTDLKSRAGEGNLICVSKDDADKYACNIILMDDHNIIMPRTSKELTLSIEDRGYNVTQVDLSQFIELGGGGAHCLVNRVNQMRRSSEHEAPEL